MRRAVRAIHSTKAGNRTFSSKHPWSGYSPLDLESLWLVPNEATDQFIQDTLSNVGALKTRYFLQDEPGPNKFRQVRVLVDVGRSCGGPPGHAHGGSTAAILDEVMGTAVWANQFASLTSSIEVKYLRPMPIPATYLIEANIESVEQEDRQRAGRSVKRTTISASASISSEETGVVHSSSTGSFVEIKGRKVGPFAHLLVDTDNT